MRKKILFLVAGRQQLPVIQYAKKRGYYVMTCDNEPLNPGHELADDRFNISTLDKEKILEKVENLSIDAVVNFISANGLVSSAYIAEKLNLNGIKPDTLALLLDKYKFREFLRKHSFCFPNYNVSDQYNKDLDEGMRYPLMIKPVDRGGNVGVKKIEKKEFLKDAFGFAKENSLSGNVIIEEFIPGDFLLNGDFLIVENKVIYSLIGDYHYDSGLNGILPYATTFPSKIEEPGIASQLEKMLKFINYGSGIFNVEIFLSGNDIYFIEINPRHSGNLIYKLMSVDTEIDFAEVSVELALGNSTNLGEIKSKNQYLAYCILCSCDSGIFENVELSKEIEGMILDKIIYKKSGQRVEGFQTMHDRIGLLLMKFQSRREMDYIIKNIREFYTVHLRKNVE